MPNQWAQSSTYSFRTRTLLLSRSNQRMGKVHLFSFLLLPAVFSHEIYPGKCPDFTPMKQFDWTKFSSGVWYVIQKFDTKSSCLTYEFKTDNLGFKSVEQIRQLPFKEAIGVDHQYKYTGKLFDRYC
ncbi:uncharacterized protein LOC111699024 isoform X3 [Eurytemora carolleeae]|uniref:uncharacterized protein LOC111699024 isoform X3 n=1 Tax=Eurytemora carolleeae TaxID=1294199 RepID=UPI000C77D669|nr:uncharacterized protein LOC111699024 isoform X3 [Eurytemora carolleeae]|eukprot:XP_023325326.1 uncharacterized protein LOC111699024 isoform X3 [Eurytemora affinis]